MDTTEVMVQLTTIVRYYLTNSNQASIFIRQNKRVYSTHVNILRL